MRTFSFCIAFILLAAACDSGTPDAEPQRTEAQDEAARRACISGALVRVSHDEVETIEAAFGVLGEGAAPQTQAATARFARTLLQHAELRHAAFAHADSALNVARTPADSARYMDAAQRFTTRPPESGTLEANVMAAYERRFIEAYEDEDHRCNWNR